MDNCQQVHRTIHAERKGPNPIELAFISQQVVEFLYLRKANRLWNLRKAAGASFVLQPCGYASVRGGMPGQTPVQ
ncbi:hypothetical protein [Oleidesulfovibrio sp.]|uniref:hypothetical protein n=1 Tax=Oleidesulfovibrio sp. TaxID=2909707 RepID=UPI003A8BB133